MDQSALSSRAVVGMYYERLAAQTGMAWVDAVSNDFGSDQEGETYAFLGASPAMREWIGGRQAKGLRANSFFVRNKHYEATLEVRLTDLRRDKTGQLIVRIDEFIDRGRTHWASLLSTLILAGESTVGYDGEYFFDTDHAEGNSGTQSNDIDVDISALAATLHGSTTAPSVEEMQQAILKAISQMSSFVDDQGEPINEGASRFVVIVPLSFYMTALAAVSMPTTVNLSNNFNPNLLANLQISVVPNPRLSSWTTKFVVIRADGPLKPFIRQSEQDIDVKVKDEDSDYAFDNDAIQIGIDAWRNVAYGFWQRAVLVTLI